LVRYFVVVTGVLLAMLAVVNWCLPSEPPGPDIATAIDRSTLHIRSERKWPQKVEFDTTMQPFIAPSAPAVATSVVAAHPETPPLDAVAEARPADKPSEVAKPKPHVRMAHRTPRTASRMMVAANPAAPAWSFGWGEPAPGAQKQAQDTRPSSHGNWFGERNTERSRQNIASWGWGSSNDW
jgi:hypothetical protein